MIPWLADNKAFPPVTQALRMPDGLLAAGGDLSVPRLLEAYRNGIFPWFNPGEPILWWSPDPRMVLAPPDFRVSRSLGKLLRRHDYEVRFDTAFEQVMRHCAAPRATQSGTWIGEDMIAAYGELHRQGYAHSVEVWMPGSQLAREDQHRAADGVQLAGGLYGVALGRMFYGESMFSLADNASKIALACLARQLARWQFGMIDCQMNTPHLASLGAREISRNVFITRLKELIHCAPVTDWKFDTDLF